MAGYSYGATPRAFVTGPNGEGLKDLGTLPGGNYSYADAVNDSGQVAGYGNDGSQYDSNLHAFLSKPNGGR